MSRKRHHKSFHVTSEQLDEVLTVSTETRGFIILGISLISLLSILSFAYAHDSGNWLGMMGHLIGKVWFAILGLGTYPALFFCGWIGWRQLFNKPTHHIYQRTVYVGICVLALNLLLSVIEDTLPALSNWLGETFLTEMWSQHYRYHLGGAPIYFIYRDLPGLNLRLLLNTPGVSLVSLAMFGMGLLYLCKSNPKELLNAIVKGYRLILSKLKKPPPPQEYPVEAVEDVPFQRKIIGRSRPTFLPLPANEELLPSPPDPTLLINRRSTQKLLVEPPPVESPQPGAEEKRSEAIRSQRVYNGDFSHYNLPDANLLTPAKPIDTTALHEELRQQADILEETLLNFGIVAKVGNINCGPTITSFEVHPAVGVKVGRIKALENDIALNLQAKSIRIIAPIPGKAAVGIEVPNSVPQEVSFQEILNAYQKGSKRFHIPMLLGKAVNGDLVMSDLTKMPHLIIAGATGSGKSVCINTIVMSIVLNCKPDEVKLVMVDPKKVELTPYSRLPHMLAPVITEPGGACSALQWMVKEMESRYELLKILGLRNIEAFNTRTRDLEKETSLDRDVPEHLPYIVGIIDELADLMMVSSHDIETYIARIAQMARAVGIHLILATQRPSREVITGLIKANFPARISFKVASRVNSQIILDEIGAEMLLGNGDMLFLPPGTSHLMRAQGAYIRDQDINAVIEHICKQAPPRYVIESFDTMTFSSEERDSRGEDDEPADALYDQAKDTVLKTGNASTTFLQRKLKVGYARAASLMDMLERRGIVGPADGAKPRKILAAYHQLDDDEDLEE